MTELELLRCLGNRDNWNKYAKFVKRTSLSKDASAIYDAMRAYYPLHPAVTEVDWDAFLLWFQTVRTGSIKEVTAELYKELILKVKTTPVPSNNEEVIKHFVTMSYADDIETKLRDIRKGSGKMDDVLDLVHKCQHEIGTKLEMKDVFVERDLHAAAIAFTTGGWEWPIEELNMSCGPLRDKTFSMFAARPEMGKTTFASHCVAYWLTRYGDKMSGPIIWVNNEEDSDDVYNRVVQSILGISASAIHADPAAAESNLRFVVPRINDLLLITRNDTANDINTLDSLFIEHKPSCIVFDQLDKVEGFGDSDEHVRLGKVYKWAKGHAHRLPCKVLALSQASDGATNQRYFDYSYLRGSKTDKAGEGDIIITMGKEWGDPDDARFLYVCKNKKAGGPKVDPLMRHLKFEATIIPETGRFTSHFTKGAK